MRDVVSCLPGEILAHFPEIQLSTSPNTPIDAACTSVVGGKNEVPITEIGVEVLHVTRSCPRGFLEIAALVIPKRYFQAVETSCRPNKLPEPHSFGPGLCVGTQSAFCHRKINEFFGDPFFSENFPHRREVLASEVQPSFEVIPSPVHEEANRTLDILIIRKRHHRAGDIILRDFDFGRYRGLDVIVQLYKQSLIRRRFAKVSVALNVLLVVILNAFVKVDEVLVRLDIIVLKLFQYSVGVLEFGNDHCRIPCLFCGQCSDVVLTSRFHTTRNQNRFRFHGIRDPV